MTITSVATGLAAVGLAVTAPATGPATPPIASAPEASSALVASSSARTIALLPAGASSARPSTPPSTGESAARAAASRTPAVRLTARFGPGARLGRSSPLSIGLRVDPRRIRAALTDIRLLTPADLDIATSELGTATCRRPASDFERVRIGNQVPATCPANALLGSGTADAELRFSDDQALTGSGRLRLFSGAPVDDRPGLALLVATDHPVTTQLVYGGYLYTAPRPYGLGMRIRIPTMQDPPFGAAVALVGLRMTIGDGGIVYTRREHGHRIRYAPGGIPLPDRCPRGGFPFRAVLRFDDGSRRTADATVPCPKRR